MSNNMPTPEVTIAMQQAIAEANASIIRLILTAARTKDPIGAFLLGVDQATLDEYEKVNSYDLISASKIGAPIFRLMLSDAASVRSAFTTGCSSATVLQQLTRNMPTLKAFTNSHKKDSE